MPQQTTVIQGTVFDQESIELFLHFRFFPYPTPFAPPKPSIAIESPQIEGRESHEQDPQRGVKPTAGG